MSSNHHARYRFREIHSTGGFSHASLTTIFTAEPGSPSENFRALMEGHALSRRFVQNAGPKEVRFYKDNQMLIKPRDTKRVWHESKNRWLTA